MARILVIDDEVNVCKSIRRVLKLEDHEVFEANDGRQGLKLLEEKSVDLVITDIFMPDKGGINTIMQLRVDYPHVKIIAISGGGRTIDYLEIAKDLGAHCSLKKPFTDAQLLEAVHNLLF